MIAFGKGAFGLCTCVLFVGRVVSLPINVNQKEQSRQGFLLRLHGSGLAPNAIETADIPPPPLLPTDVQTWMRTGSVDVKDEIASAATGLQAVPASMAILESGAPPGANFKDFANAGLQEIGGLPEPVEAFEYFDVNVSNANSSSVSNSTDSESKKDGHAVVKPECVPGCSWKCDTPKCETSKCDQVCKPTCKAPKCQTRCTGLSTNGCRMECGKPDCAVVYPKKICANSSCPIAETHCSKPMCKLVCPPDSQNCKDVCENPSCSWKCEAPPSCPKPVCPKPRCKMQCDQPKGCAALKTSSKLPPLKKGELVVDNFEAPLSFAQKLRSNSKISQAHLPKLQVSLMQAFSVQGSNAVEFVHSAVALPTVDARDMP